MYGYLRMRARRAWPHVPACGCIEMSAAVQVNMHHLLKTLMETAYAMRHLHNMHILHRDLKIQNILLKSSNKDSRGFTVKVSDFGLARIWDGRGRGHSPTEKQKYAGAVTRVKL
jgi:serine/threonine protein kinase